MELKLNNQELMQAIQNTKDHIYRSVPNSKMESKLNKHLDALLAEEVKRATND